MDVEKKEHLASTRRPKPDAAAMREALEALRRFDKRRGKAVGLTLNESLARLTLDSKRLADAPRGFTQIPNSLLFNSALSPTARLVMMALISRDFPIGGKRKGVAWPSVGSLARLLYLGERTVQRALRELEACGYIDIERGAGRGKTPRYRIKLPLDFTRKKPQGDAVSSAPASAVSSAPAERPQYDDDLRATSAALRRLGKVFG